MGLSPYTAPGVYNLLPGTELLDGVYYPMGGWAGISKALQDIALSTGNVTIQTNTNVRRINTDSSGQRIASLTVSSRGGEKEETIACETVVCNRDVPAAYELIQSSNAQTANYVQQTADRLDGLEYSCGVIAYYWCVLVPPRPLVLYSQALT